MSDSLSNLSLSIITLIQHKNLLKGQIQKHQAKHHLTKSKQIIILNLSPKLLY